MSFLGGRYYSEEELATAGFRKIGRNVKIHNRASIYCPENITIGSNVRIDDFVMIIASGHLELGNNVHIANYCYLGCTSGIRLEDFSGLAPNVLIFSSSDDYGGEYLTNPTVPKEYTGGARGPVVMKKHVIVGAGTVILPGVVLEEGVSVGALSLVNRNLAEWGVYAGRPAKRLKDRSKKLLELEMRYIASQKKQTDD